MVSIYLLLCSTIPRMLLYVCLWSSTSTSWHIAFSPMTCRVNLHVKMDSPNVDSVLHWSYLEGNSATCHSDKLQLFCAVPNRAARTCFQRLYVAWLCHLHYIYVVCVSHFPSCCSFESTFVCALVSLPSLWCVWYWILCPCQKSVGLVFYEM